MSSFARIFAFAVFSCEPAAFCTTCRRPTCRSKPGGISMHSSHAYPQLSMLLKINKKKTQKKPKPIRGGIAYHCDYQYGEESLPSIHTSGLRCCMYFPYAGLFPVSCKSNISMIMQDFIVHFMEFYCCQFCAWFCQVYLINLSINQSINQLLIHSFNLSIYIHTHTCICKERTFKMFKGSKMHSIQ